MEAYSHALGVISIHQLRRCADGLSAWLASKRVGRIWYPIAVPAPTLSSLIAFCRPFLSDTCYVCFVGWVARTSQEDLTHLETGDVLRVHVRKR